MLHKVRWTNECVGGDWHGTENTDIELFVFEKAFSTTSIMTDLKLDFYLTFFYV